jgi:hypothetical protein
MAGLEPARPKEHRILSPACLPIPPHQHHSITDCNRVVYYFTKLIQKAITLHEMERKTGFEPLPMTAGRRDPVASLNNKTKLTIILKKYFQSEKRDSNPRPPPWQGGALPAELFSQNVMNVASIKKQAYPFWQAGANLNLFNKPESKKEVIFNQKP